MQDQDTRTATKTGEGVDNSCRGRRRRKLVLLKYQGTEGAWEKTQPYSVKSSSIMSTYPGQGLSTDQLIFALGKDLERKLSR